MKPKLAGALAFCAVIMASGAALAQNGPPQCGDFIKLRDDAQQRAQAVRNATEKKADRKEICLLMTRFTNSEQSVVKFLESNKTWCNIPDQAVKQAKSQHEKTLQYRTAACAEAPARPRGPTLSDAISTPTIDTAGNTKTGHGTLDSLTGNPLAR